MFQHFSRLTWYHCTRGIAIVLIVYALGIENDPGTRGTMITAAIGIIAAEPVARREKVAPKD